MATKIGSDIKKQFSAAEHIVKTLGKFAPAARARILELVNEYEFTEEEAPNPNQVGLFEDEQPAAASAE